MSVDTTACRGTPIPSDRIIEMSARREQCRYCGRLHLDWYGVLSTRDSNPHAFAAAQEALRIDPELAEAHASLALARQYRGSGAGPKNRFVARSRSTHTSNVTALADVAKVSLNPGALALGSTSWIRPGPRVVSPGRV